jgi:hypothetical protein
LKGLRHEAAETGYEFERYAEEKVQGFAGVGAAAAARYVWPGRGFGAGTRSIA